MTIHTQFTQHTPATICVLQIFAGQVSFHQPSVLWCCWLSGRKGIWPVTNWVVGAGVVICLELGADLHMAQLMPLSLPVSCFSKIQFGFAFLVPAHPGSPGKRAIKWVCVCVRPVIQSAMSMSTAASKGKRRLTFYAGSPTMDTPLTPQ